MVLMLLNGFPTVNTAAGFEEIFHTRIEMNSAYQQKPKLVQTQWEADM